jgi:hypothetical protein
VEPSQSGAGWHPDPSGRFDFRYYNGERWTHDVSVAGQRFVEPQGTPPAEHLDPSNRRGMALASFCISLVSFMCAWLPFFFVAGIIGAITALILGAVARGRIRRHEAGGKGFVTAGLVLSIAALLASIVGFALTRVVLRELDDFLEPGPYTARIDSCDLDGRLITLEGSITNLDTEQRSYTVTVEYRLNGDRIELDVTRVRDVAPNATANFETSAFIDVDDSGATDAQCSIESVTGPALFTR